MVCAKIGAQGSPDKAYKIGINLIKCVENKD